MSKNLYAFSQPIELFLDIKDPVLIFYKDKNSIYMGCNDFMAKITGVSPMDIIGKSDFDLCWAEEAECLRKDDQNIFQRDITKFFLEPITTIIDERLIDLSLKTPLKNAAGQTIGVFGISFPLRDIHNYDITKMLFKEKIDLAKIMQTAKQDSMLIGGIALTPRKLDCLYYLARGKKTKEIAKIMGNLSSRTIEDHIIEMKLQLGCTSTAQLIDKAWEINLPILYNPQTVGNYEIIF